jgi:hypothetical protein
MAESFSTVHPIKFNSCFSLPSVYTGAGSNEASAGKDEKAKGG